MNLKKEQIEKIKDYYIRHGHKIQEYNLFAVRNLEGLRDDIFNDCIGYWKNDMTGNVYVGTTDPGKASIQHGGIPGTGAPFLCSGYHEDIFCIGPHGKEAYEAFVNRSYKGCKRQRIIRDKNRNFKFDVDEKISFGWFSINLHRASRIKDVDVIGPYSEGCSVVRHAADHMEMITTAKKTDMYLKNPLPTLFSYMIFELPEMNDIYDMVIK